MKICFLANPASSHTQKWVNHFCGRGDEVHLLCFEDVAQVVPKAIVHRLNASWGPFRYFAAADQVKRIMESVQPDLLHAHYAAGYGTLGRLSGFHPYIVSVWGSDVFEVPDKSPLHKAVIVRNLASADHVCSTSRFMADRTRQYYKGPITVTPFGVDCDRFRPFQERAGSQGGFVIGTVKILEQIYGLEYLIKAFAAIVKKYKRRKKMRLVIAGDGSQKAKLRKLSVELGVDSATEFLGAIPQEEVPTVLNRLSVFVVPSLFETFGVAALEASACALPVIVTDAAGLREVIEPSRTALVVPARDEVAMADAISKVIDDENLRKSLGEMGRDFVLKRYQWLRTAEVMEEVYEAIMAAPSSGPREAMSVHA